MLLPPMFIMFAVTFSAIILNVKGNIESFVNGKGTFLVNGLQLIVAAFLIVLGVLVLVHVLKN